MTATAAPTPAEATASFPCFGGVAALHVVGDGAEPPVLEARRRLESWHARFTRFDANSELSRLNASRLRHVRVSRLLAHLVACAAAAARSTAGLVDPTLVAEIEDAGYDKDFGTSVPLDVTLGLAPPRKPARPRTDARCGEIGVDAELGIVTRPPGVRLDSGGIAKGLFADLIGGSFEQFESYAVDCCGDLRLGGRGALARQVRVDDPFGRGVLHEFALTGGGAATSGIGRRSWLDPDGRPAHHLLDPSTGRPAFTGVVQATALARSAADAEVRAKAALLSGPEVGIGWLGNGGVLVYDDGSHDVVEPHAIRAR
jgi:FAD:protein FMN transferase